MQRLLPPEEDPAPDDTARFDGGFSPTSPWRSSTSGRPDQHLARWVRRRSFHGFVDFSHAFRPWTRGVSVQGPAAACAQTEIHADQDADAALHLAWDDQLIVTVNDEPPLDLGSQPSFRRRAIPIQLRRGVNRLRLKLSNTKGQTWGAWCFTCHVTRPDGRILSPGG